MSDLDAALAGLRARFLARAQDDRRTLRLWPVAAAARAGDHALILHRLAGAAGTFGFHELSDRAKRAEEALAEGRGADDPDVVALLRELDRVLERA